MQNDIISVLTGELIDDDVELSLAELCRACQIPAERILEFIDEGIIEPYGSEPAQWRFYGIGIRRIRCAIRLQHDLGINLSGVALALDLLEEITVLRRRLQQFER